MCERCFLRRSLRLLSRMYQCPSCCSRSSCRSQIASILGNLGSPRGQSKGYKNQQRRLHSPFPDPTQLDRVTDHHKCLCKSSPEQVPDRGTACTYTKECSRTGQISEVSRFLQCVQNSLTRIVANTTKYSHITLVRKALHWLPIKYCSIFKTAVLVYKFLHSGNPKYFESFLIPRHSAYNTRRSQSDGMFLEVPIFASVFKSQKHFGLSFT